MGVVTLHEGETSLEGATSLVRGGAQETWGRKAQSNSSQGSHTEFLSLNTVDVNTEDFAPGPDTGSYDTLFLWVVPDKETRGSHVEHYRAGWGNYGGRCAHREGTAARGRDCGLLA